MKDGYILNPIDEYVATIKQRVRDNGGYCLYADKNNKKNKCPKYCKNTSECLCGMYIQSIESTEQ